jgi:hypothetical protein
VPSITLSLPVAGQTILAGPLATNFAALQTLLNGGLDGTNWNPATNLTVGSLTTGGPISANSINTVFGISASTEAVIRSGNTLGQVKLGIISGPNGGLTIGTAEDVNLYRLAANVLATDDQIRINRSGSAGSQVSMELYAAAESFSRLQINNDGTLYFGGGAGAHDVILTRSAASTLNASGSFTVSSALTAARIYVGSDVQLRDDSGSVTWGISDDVRLQRTAANQIEMASGDTFKVAAVGLKFNDNTIQTTAAVGASALVPATTLPGSPTNGQQAILTDSTSAPTWTWLLQYSTAASKWLFLGGSRLVVAGGGTLTLPRAGTYDIVVSGTLGASTAGDGDVNLTTTPSSGTVTGKAGLRAQIGSSLGGTWTVTEDVAAQFRVTGASAGATIPWGGDTANATTASLVISAIPVTIT